jgi:hypothetical protein
MAEVRASLNHLMVLVGAPAAAGALPSGGESSILVVEADLERAQRLRQQLGGDPQVVLCVEVLAARSEEPVPWFQFNDGRLNGPLSLEAWRDRYPNLRQLGEEQRRGRRLEDVLEAWAAKRGLAQRPSLTLQLRQGDPLKALEGLGNWTQALQRVELALPGGVTQSAGPLQAWLVERGFRAGEGDEHAWERDPLATQQLQIREQEQQIAELEEQLSTQAVRLLLVKTRQDELTAERDQLRADHQELRSQRDTFLSERDLLQARVEELQVQLSAQNEQTAEQSQQREVLQARVEELQVQLSAQSEQTAEQSQQREVLQARVEELQGQLNVQSAQTAEQSHQREVLQNQVHTLEERLDRINIELDEILALINQDRSDAQESCEVDVKNV